MTQHSLHEPLMGLCSLLRMTLDGADVDAVGARLVERATRDAGDANALLDLATLLQLRFRADLAGAVQEQALHVSRRYHLGPPADAARLRLLALVAPGDLMSNTPIECLVEGSDIALELLYVTADDALPTALPDHDVVIVAVGEPDRNSAVLERVAEVLALTPRPVLNAPGRVRLLARDSACQRLCAAPGVAMPRTARLDRDALHALASADEAAVDALIDGTYPLIVRPVGSHAGRALERVGNPVELRAYLDATPGASFYVSRFVDYRSEDGQYRKYRVVLMGGTPYLCHMAISSHWMVHYLNAGMAECASKRAEEEAAMATFDTGFAIRHRKALRAIHERMQLDYLGIDCAQAPSGELLVFEVDTGMVVHGLDSPQLYPYKREQMRKVFRAFEDLLVAASEGVTATA